jgi:drug/metabolite transporter (DMT)-like permease
MGSLVTPLFGVFCAWFVLGEKPGYIEGVGMLLIGVALLFLTVLAMKDRHAWRPDTRSPLIDRD